MANLCQLYPIIVMSKKIGFCQKACFAWAFLKGSHVLRDFILWHKPEHFTTEMQDDAGPPLWCKPPNSPTMSHSILWKSWGEPNSTYFLSAWVPRAQIKRCKNKDAHISCPSVPNPLRLVRKCAKMRCTMVTMEIEQNSPYIHRTVSST